MALLSSLIWGIIACSLARRDLVSSRKVVACLISQAPLRRPTKYTKFDEVLFVYNQLNFENCMSDVKFRLVGD